MRQSDENGESNVNCRFISTVISNDNVTILRLLRFVAPIVTKIERHVKYALRIWQILLKLLSY